MSNGLKEAVKGRVSKSNRETVIAQDFTGKFTLQIQKLLEVDSTCSVSLKSQLRTPIPLAVQLPLTRFLGFQLCRHSCLLQPKLFLLGEIGCCMWLFF